MRATQRAGSTLWVTPPAHLTDAAMDGILDELRENLRGHEPYAIVFDMTHADVPDALQRRKLVDHMAANADAIKRLVRGLAVVVPSPIFRGIITALFWLAPPEVPHAMFAMKHDAFAWAEAM